MGFGGGPPPPALTPARSTAAEVIHDSARTRVTRLFLPEGNVIRKEPLGPGREQRLRQERAILERLAGVPGMAQLASTPSGPESILLADIRGSALVGRTSPLEATQLLRLALGLARVVAAMHARGVVHRDLNPANILLAGDEDRPCLIDFAYATTSADIRPVFTHQNEIVGTLPYLAPEQTGRTGRPVDHRADLYALGAILYECATGAPPFGTGNALRLIHDHLTRVPVPPAQLNPAVGTVLSDVIMHLLAKEPDSRYQTAEGLVRDLTRLRDGGPATTTPRLGRHDAPLRPLPPSRPVGRDHEIAALRSAFANALSGRHRGVVVTGPAGVGKTSLINELRSIATANDGWFVAGKFDQYRRDQEFDALWQAFRSLGRMLLAEPEEQLADLRRRLHHALGPGAGLMARLHPEFATVLQVEPDQSIGDPSTMQARLAHIRVQTLGAVAGSGRPIVLAVDDLQWVARTPLGFLDQAMSGEPGLDGVLLVAACRDDDLNATCPLAATLARWRRQPGIEQLALDNLSPADLATLLSDMLVLDADQGGHLATLVWPHTHGNPYETVELLRSLGHDGMLEPGGNGRRWDPAALRRRLDHADVAELLAQRASDLPAPSHALVQAMACLGGQVDLCLLQAATGLRAAEVDERLLPALDDGLLVTEPGHKESVRFGHDRVQETVLCRLGQPRRRALRLDLARRLAAQPDQFAVAADQYLPEIDAVQEPEERARVVAILRRAADQAQMLGNYAVAERRLAAAAELTDPTDTATLIAVSTGQHAALYHLGRLDDADEVFARLDLLCRTPTERIDATLVQVSSLTNRNQPQQAVRLGLDLLAPLGCAAPAPDRLDAEVDRELDDLARWVRGGSEEDDLARPEITDPALLAIGAVIHRILAPAYFCDHRMMAWLALSAWRIWQQHGPGRTLVGPVCQIANVTIGRRRHQLEGHRLMQRVMAVSQARGYEPETSQARLLYAFAGWRLEPLEDCVQLARQAREGLVNGGDVQNACFTYYATLPSLDIAPLDSSGTELKAGVTCARRIGSAQTTDVLEIHRRMVSLLRGELPGAAVSVIGAPERYDNNPPAVVAVHMQRAVAGALFGDRAELEAQTAAMMPMLSALAGTYPTALAHVLRAMALAEQVRSNADAANEAVVTELDRTVDQVAAFSADSPANFLHLLRLVEAERAWAVGDFRAATYAFDAAMREAGTRQRPWHRALILERAARFCLAHGMAHSGHALLADARHAYLAWGAMAKVDQLDWAFPRLQAPLADRAGADGHQLADSPTGRSHLAPGTVDLVSILAASQALSSETGINGLRERVVEVLRTMTGATGVHLLMWNDDQDTWLLTTPSDADGAVVPLDEAGERGLVPVSAVRYADRTGEPLVVDDATRDERFARDPYVAGLDRCSLLVVPIRSGGAVPAVLVLENRLIRGAFTAERLDAVILIAGQLAVSLNNTMVYSSLERMVAERTEELAHANQRLERLSVTDALTGLANRRRLGDVLSGEWSRAHRSGTRVALAMLDIDHFKSYNDRFGHVAGDRCLQRVASLLQRHVREVDLVARYGGEEFAIVMPGADLDAARAAAERLRAAVVALGEPHPLVPGGVVTVSIGVASMTPGAPRRVSHLAEQADAELYRAKDGGRNRVAPARRADDVRSGAGNTVGG